ncbi:hypothetical protein ASF86_11755 [Acinetobacter sp. Leaf130]|nr:hypothetical protein ASF86_11755 [Acinetobacter sp. Leaf130]
MKQILIVTLFFLLADLQAANAATMSEMKFNQYSYDTLEISKSIRKDLEVANENKDIEAITQQVCKLYLINKEILKTSERNREYVNAKINITYAKYTLKMLSNTSAFNNDSFDLKRDCR